MVKKIAVAAALILLTLVGGAEIPEKTSSGINLMTPKGFADEENWMRGNRPGRNEENEYVFYFLENGYSSMLQQRAVHGKGRYVFHADCRWKGDFKNNKFSRVNLSFFDKNGKTVKTSSNAAVVLSRTAGVQNIDLDISVPEGAETYRVQFESHGACPLAITNADFRFIPASNPAEAKAGEPAPAAPGSAPAPVDIVEKEEPSGTIVLADQSSFSDPEVFQLGKLDHVVLPDGTFSLTFRSDSYSGIIAHFPLAPRMCGKFVMTAEVELDGELSNMKFTRAALILLDAAGKSIRVKDAAKASAVIQQKRGVQTLRGEITIPENGETPDRLRILFESHGAPKLKIRNFKLELQGLTPTDAAIRGIPLRFMKQEVSPAGPARPDWAEVEIFDCVPYDLNAAFWAERPVYQLVSRGNDKSPFLADDCRATFSLAADPDFLYVFFTAVDDKLNFNYEQLHERDCFEFFLSPYGRSRQRQQAPQLEHYMVTMTPDFKPRIKGECNALAEVIEHGWKALLRIPLQTDVRKIHPFNGLELTFNAAYQDADTLSQEHWLGYSPLDPSGESWKSTLGYAPIRFTSQKKFAFRRMFLGGENEYQVAPVYPGRLNLAPMPPDIHSICFWEHQPDTVVGVENGVFSLKFSDFIETVIPVFPCFSVMPGETIEFEYEGRVDRGQLSSAPHAGFITQVNWNGFHLKFPEGTKPPPLTQEWTKVKVSGVVPDLIRENMRNGRLLFFLPQREIPGKTLYLRNLRVSRRLPVDFDAMIKVPHLYPDFPQGEKAELEITFDTPRDIKATATLAVTSFFDKRSVYTTRIPLELKKGMTVLRHEIPGLPNGFFNVTLKVRDEKGGYLADRERYISRTLREGGQNRSSGIWFQEAYSLTPPVSIKDMVETLKSLGYGTVFFGGFNTLGKDYKPLTTTSPVPVAKEFQKAGFQTCTSLTRGVPGGIKPISTQPADLIEYFRETVRLADGSINYWGFDNEPNILWTPIPDGRDYAAYYRPVFHAVKEGSPSSRVFLGAMNNMPTDFPSAMQKLNRNLFADGIFTVHLYRFEYNSTALEDILARRRVYDQLYPGWEVWDTESGLVRHSFSILQEMQTKRLPILLTAGIARNCFYTDRDLMLPGGDATAIFPAEGFKNRFYIDVKPVGRAVLADGAVHCYVFLRKDGSYCAVYWNTGFEEKTVSLPEKTGFTVLDQFGNRLSASERDTLADRFVRYAEHVDGKALAATPNFIAAFQSSRETPFRDDGFTENVWLIQEMVTHNFDFEFTIGEERNLPLILRNDSNQEQTVTLQFTGPSGLAATFERGGVYRLAPGETRKVAAIMKAEKPFGISDAGIGGRCGEGKLVPLMLTARTAGPVSVVGYTSFIELKNNTGRKQSVRIMPSTGRYDFTLPEGESCELSPEETKQIPVQVRPKTWQFKSAFNNPTPYLIQLQLDDSECSSSQTLFGFCAQPYTAGVVGEPAFLTKLPDAPTMNWQLFRGKEKLRLVAEVEDDSPIQTGTTGYIREGGDCLVFGMVTDGKYREYGFALKEDKPSSYRWDGRYGLESAVECPDAIRSIVRIGNKIRYDVEVECPEKGDIPFSLLVIDRGEKRPDKILELGYGIRKRNSDRMGILLAR